jgi:hypothetical protein
MGRILRITVAGGLVAVVLASPVDAPASGRGAIFPGTPLTATFHVRGSNGYGVSVYGSRDRVTLIATRGRASTGYEVKGKVSPDGVRARFGRFGRISVSFRERRVRRVPSSILGCTGGPEVIRRGVYLGTIKFRGERGYTSLRARAVRGTTTVTPRWRCPGSSSGNRKVPDQIDLDAFCGRQGFAAVGHRSVDQGPRVFPDEDTSTTFIAFSVVRRGRIRVIRLAAAKAGRSAFLFDDAFTFATVKPPPPFHGTGMLTRDPSGGGSWSGSLSVSFPGKEVDLIDSRFRVALVRFREERMEGSYVLPPRAPCAADRRPGESVAQLPGGLGYVAPVSDPGGQ